MFWPAPVVISPPTRFALKARPFFVGLLAAQALLIACRFFILDLWGAMLMLMVVMMGSFVVSTGGGMDTTYCLYYGLMCLVTGVFDIIACVERWVHVKYPLFSKNAPLMYNVASMVYIVCPLVELASCMLAAAIYADAQETESRLMLPHYAPADVGAGRGESSQARGPGRPSRPHLDQGFVPFEGRCHQL
mmetsp:Transcript_18588/g.53246  ORF Transcript_18588/g.53246 Transcript_18588/m.53246 type:complete len:190 (+) Transcript_18588:196-765(+)